MAGTSRQVGSGPGGARNEAIVVTLPEDPLGDERIEHAVADVVAEAEEAHCLRRGERQARHLAELAADTRQQQLARAWGATIDARSNERERWGEYERLSVG